MHLDRVFRKVVWQNEKKILINTEWKPIGNCDQYKKVFWFSWFRWFSYVEIMNEN